MIYVPSLYPSFFRAPNKPKLSLPMNFYSDLVLKASEFSTSLFMVLFALEREGKPVAQWKDLLLRFQNDIHILRGHHDR